VRAGFETAIAAALGSAADAVAVRSLADAAAAINLLRRDDAGRAGLLVGAATGSAPEGAADPSRPTLDAGVVWAVDVVTAPELVRPALRRLLGDTVVVDDLATAQRLVQAHPRLRAATRDGDLLGAGWASGGSGSAPSLLEVRAAYVETETHLSELGHQADRLRFALAAADEQVSRAQDAVETALVDLHESDARMAAIAERLGQLGAAARAAAGETERYARGIEEAVAARDSDLEGLVALEERLTAAQALPDDEPPDETERHRVDALVVESRASEVEARLAVRTGEERADALARRIAELQAAAEAEREARERAVALAARREREAIVAAAVATVTSVALEAIDRSLQAAAEQRSDAESRRTVAEGELLALRERSRELSEQLEGLTSAVHRDEVARAEQRLRIETLEAKVAEEFGISPEVLIAEYGPDMLVPPAADAPEGSEPVAYDRAEQEKRWRAAERALALLGKVNPLALEEFAALEERHKFLSDQLEDLRASRRDLLVVVKEVDERVEQVFRAAYEDVAREFEHVFGRLFPGGSGRLVLTDPDDWLTTGVDVEARPPGKKVKRLSLLSGGERSLTAIALLVAIFRARPSPFYVLDEVEAALDDHNLGRLVDLLGELKSTSQLIVITHQKRTMEVADTLYGVSMRGDGITEVISQRLRELEPEPV
jgi:chromosome segregation protein